MDFSAAFVINETNKKLKELGLDWKDVILSGRSQGAFMAMYIALSGKASPGKVISLCGAYADEMLQKGLTNKDTEIIWIEAAKDTVITDEKRNSYKNLQAKGCDITYILDENSDHDNLDSSVINHL